MQWKKVIHPPPEKAAALAESLTVPFPIAQLFLQRGIEDFERAKYYFRPEWSLLQDPFLMQDMEVAVSRIVRAIEDGERAMVFGDYDLAGTTGAGLVASSLIDKSTTLQP